MTTRTKRSAGLIAVAAMAMLVLSACINVTYKLTVNSDATLSGSFTAAVSKEVMSGLGVTSKDLLGEAITSGDMDLGVDAEVAQACQESEDETNFIVTCTVANVQASDLDDAWTQTGDELTFNVVSESQAGIGEESLMPEGMGIGKFSFTATFPGPISSITGNGATKVDDNTVTIAGSLSENFDVTVVASSEPSGSGQPVWILVILAIAFLAVFALAIVLLRKGKKKEEPAETPTEAPPTADSSDPSI